MIRLKLDQVKKIQMEILDFVSAFCDANGVRYWIDCGTLLGAIRHKGYIPWDDDIDIGMLREDYEKFSKIFNGENSKYRFVCVENTPDFYLPHGKVLDTTTILYEPDERGMKISVNVDIFVYDNAPDDDALVEKMYDRRDLLRRRFYIQNEKKIEGKLSIKKIAKCARRIIYRVIYPQNYIEQMVSNAKRFNCLETSRVGNFTSFARMVCDKKVFVSFVEVEFEGKMYKAPVGYDEWLRSFYGEYMTLPPIEKRVSHHSYIAYSEK